MNEQIKQPYNPDRRRKPAHEKAIVRGGFRWIGSQPYVRVTTVLGDVINKPALQQWYGKQVYLAMVQNPELGEKEALAAPWKVSQDAMDRGSAVHEIVELDKESDDIEQVDEKYRGYLKAYRKWKTDSGIDVLEHEKTIFSHAEGYTGQIDLIVKTPGDERVTIVDVKTGKGIYPEALMQVAAYQQAAEEHGYDTNGTGVLLLRPTGSYLYDYNTTQENERQYKGFLAAKTIFEAKHEEDLKKIGYFVEEEEVKS